MFPPTSTQRDPVNKTGANRRNAAVRSTAAEARTSAGPPVQSSGMTAPSRQALRMSRGCRLRACFQCTAVREAARTGHGAGRALHAVDSTAPAPAPEAGARAVARGPSPSAARAAAQPRARRLRAAARAKASARERARAACSAQARVPARMRGGQLPAGRLLASAQDEGWRLWDQLPVPQLLSCRGPAGFCQPLSYKASKKTFNYFFQRQILEPRTLT